MSRIGRSAPRCAPVLFFGIESGRPEGHALVEVVDVDD